MKAFCKFLKVVFTTQIVNCEKLNIHLRCQAVALRNIQILLHSASNQAFPFGNATELRSNYFY